MIKIVWQQFLKLGYNGSKQQIGFKINYWYPIFRLDISYPHFIVIYLPTHIYYYMIVRKQVICIIFLKVIYSYVCFRPSFWGQRTRMEKWLLLVAILAVLLAIAFLAAFVASMLVRNSTNVKGEQLRHLRPSFTLTTKSNTCVKRFQFEDPGVFFTAYWYQLSCFDYTVIETTECFQMICEWFMNANTYCGYLAKTLTITLILLSIYFQ